VPFAATLDAAATFVAVGANRGLTAAAAAAPDVEAASIDDEEIDCVNSKQLIKIDDDATMAEVVLVVMRHVRERLAVAAALKVGKNKHLGLINTDRKAGLVYLPSVVLLGPRWYANCKKKAKQATQSTAVGRCCLQQ
jgi:hypothetical protein